MPKDKINYRARGPRSVLTRQTVGGRANDGGLRIGEMDRDCLIAHGLSSFIQESMLVRGDEYFVAICNKTGCIAAYNETKQIFLSPMADGPLKFTTNINNDLNITNISRKASAATASGSSKKSAIKQQRIIDDVFKLSKKN